MNAAKAKRRWMRWCRYVEATQTECKGPWGAGFHSGQIVAYWDVMTARRSSPDGLRAAWYPKWAARR